MFGLLLRSHLTLINLEEILRLSWMLSGDIMKGCGRNVIGFALLDKTVIFEKILLLRWVQFGLGFKHSFCFGTFKLVSVMQCLDGKETY